MASLSLPLKQKQLFKANEEISFLCKAKAWLITPTILLFRTFCLFPIFKFFLPRNLLFKLYKLHAFHKYKFGNTVIL